MVGWNDREAKNETIEKECKLVGLKRTTKGYELKKENYRWRAQALTEQLGLEEIAVVLQEINGQIMRLVVIWEPLVIGASVIL